MSKKFKNTFIKLLLLVVIIGCSTVGNSSEASAKTFEVGSRFGAIINEDNTPEPSPPIDQFSKDKQTEYDNKLGVLGDDVNPGENGVTKTVTGVLAVVFNSITYIGLFCINMYFFMQCAMDVLFLTAPGIRDWLSREQSKTDGKMAGIRRRTAKVACGLISESALNATGYTRSADSGKFMTTQAVEEVNWKGWMKARAGLFIGCMTYMALLMLGLVPDLIKLVTRFLFSFITNVFKALGGEGAVSTPAPASTMIGLGIDIFLGL